MLDYRFMLIYFVRYTRFQFNPDRMSMFTGVTENASH
jgi:hypothetical protein